MTAPQTGKNLITLLMDRAATLKRPSTTHKVDGKWVDTTWQQVLEDVKNLSAGLISRGVKPGDRVAIFANTSRQWVITDLAVSAARGVTVPVYSSNTPEEVQYILNNAEAVTLFVDNDAGDSKSAGRLTRIRQILAECPSVKDVVVFDGAAAKGNEIPLSAVLEAGTRDHAANPAAFDQRVAEIKPDEPSCFLYTSGTTGDPKGVILTHGNWTYEATSVQTIGLMRDDDAIMLFLPLAHSFAQVIKAAWLSLGYRMIFAESVDKLVDNLGETKPTILPAVPRVFEKVYNNAYGNAIAQPGLKGKLAKWAFGQFDKYVEAKIAGRDPSSLGFTIAKKLIFDSKVRPKINDRLGGNMRLFISGGAPLSKKIAYFFDMLGLLVLEGYGLTETSAATTVNRPERIKIGTVGAALPGTEVKIAQDGEIMIKGPGVMKGYYKNPAATAEVLEADGWFHTGDIGEIDADNYLRITDRKKDIIVTAGGKNIAPQNLENMLKTFPLVSTAMVYGDKRPYLTVLLCIAEDTAKKLLADKGITGLTYAQMAARPEVKAALQAVLDELNATQPAYNTLKRFAVMEHEFSQETGEMTPTLKVKRKFCTAKYKATLDSLYDGQQIVE